MGGGSWSEDLYKSRAKSRASTGASAFTYSSAVAMGTAPRVAHVAMDPVHLKLDPTGLKARESRDSVDHPETLAIGIFFDVTGSMAQMPVVLQTKLAQVMKLLIEKGYVAHPQILFGAIGDASGFNPDKAPLQVGQFESGIEIDDDLGKIWLEGGGGGTSSESYELVPYFFARHTTIDCWEKRGIKGYLFTMGDEKPYLHVSREQVKRLLGVDIQADIPIGDMVAAVSERYHWFHLLVPQGGNYTAETKRIWTSLLGERCLTLDSPENVAEFVAMTIGLNEGKIDVDTGVADLVSVGTDAATARKVGTSLAKLTKTATLAKSGTATGLDGGAPATGIERL